TTMRCSDMPRRYAPPVGAASAKARNRHAGDHGWSPAAGPRYCGDMEAASDQIKVVVADDHAVVRSGLRLLLEKEDDLTVVAEAGDVADALRYVRAHRPQVLVLDL